MSFDKGTEVFEELILPDNAIFKGYPSMLTINLYKGSFCLLNKRAPGKGINIRVRKEHSFEKLHTVLRGMSTAPS